MKEAVLRILFLLVLFSCKNVHKKKLEHTQIFKVTIYPAFMEAAEVTLHHSEKERSVEFLLREAQRDDRYADTFYFKKLFLSDEQFTLLDSGIIAKTFVRDSDKSKGIRDGISVAFSLVSDSDTTSLHLDNPMIGDSINYRITKNAINYFRLILTDSIVNDYLNDVESYIDRSVKRFPISYDRPIDKLRKIKYGY